MQSNSSEWNFMWAPLRHLFFRLPTKEWLEFGGRRRETWCFLDVRLCNCDIHTHTCCCDKKQPHLQGHLESKDHKKKVEWNFGIFGYFGYLVGFFFYFHIFFAYLVRWDCYFTALRGVTADSAPPAPSAASAAARVAPAPPPSGTLLDWQKIGADGLVSWQIKTDRKRHEGVMKAPWTTNSKDTSRNWAANGHGEFLQQHGSHPLKSTQQERSYFCFIHDSLLLKVDDLEPCLSRFTGDHQRKLETWQYFQKLKTTGYPAPELEYLAYVSWHWLMSIYVNTSV